MLRVKGHSADPLDRGRGDRGRRKMDDQRKRFTKYLHDAIGEIDLAIAVRDDAKIEGFRDLELIRAELRELMERSR